MTPDSAASVYQSNSIESAPPLKIVRMLYAGALRFLREAAEAYPERERNPEAYIGPLRKADAIVSELRASLNLEEGAEVAALLDALYEFVTEQVSTSILEGSEKGIANSIRVLETVQQGWREIELSQATPDIEAA